MSWPSCRDGYERRKLTTFAGQVVDDFTRTHHLVKRAEATENTRSLTLDGLGITQPDFYVLKVLLLPSLPSGDRKPVYVFFNQDENPDNYRLQSIRIFQGQIEAADYYGADLFYISDVPHQYISDLMLISGPPALWVRGGDIPTLTVKCLFWLSPYPPLDRISLRVMDPDAYIAAGSWVELWK